MPTKDRSIYASTRWIGYTNWRSPNIVNVGGGQLLLSRTRTGDAVKGWKTLIRKQQNATSGMTGTFDSFDFSRAIVNWEYKFLDFDQDPPPPGLKFYHKAIGFPISISPISNPGIGTGVALNRALIAFLKHARAVQSEFSSPIFLGELKETLQMIRRPAMGLRNILNGYMTDLRKQKKSKTPKEWKKNLSSTWLEHSFGWTPLASDLQEGYKAYSGLAARKDGEQKLVSGIGIEEVDVPSQSFTIPTFVGGGPSGIKSVQTLVTKDKAFFKYRGMIVRRVDVTLRDKLSRVGFNPEEFVPTVWELLPWSFLIDYFSNIGDVLTANAFNRADLGWSASTSVRSRITRGSVSPDYDWLRNTKKKWFVSISGDPCTFTYERRFVTRSASASIGFPTLALELPGKPAQFANMLALFSQAYALHPQHHKPRASAFGG